MFFTESNSDLKYLLNCGVFVKLLVLDLLPSMRSFLSVSSLIGDYEASASSFSLMV